jgi:sugar phosphate isomerase/epimerase
VRLPRRAGRGIFKGVTVSDIMDRIGVSATGGEARKPLEDVLASFSSMGYRLFEAWLSGRGSALDMSKGADHYVRVAQRYGIKFCSLHMRTLETASPEGVARAVEEALFAEALGARVLTFTCATKQAYIDAARKVLAGIEGHDLTLVIQVHEGRAIGTMDDLTEVLDAVGDERLKVQHEVGTFHALGTSWDKVIDRFGLRIGLVHIKDMVGDQSVALGAGEVDVPGIFRRMRALGYPGYYVIEIQNKDQENTGRYFREAVQFLKTRCS